MLAHCKETQFWFGGITDKQMHTKGEQKLCHSEFKLEGSG